MGVFKPLLPVGGEPAALRCARIAREAGVSDVIFVTGHNAEELRSALQSYDPDAIIAHNEFYRDGMYSSVQTGARALAELQKAAERPVSLEGFFILPADCCAFTADNLRVLIRRLREDKGEHVIRPAHKERRGHPPLIPIVCLRLLLTYVGEDGLRGFLAPLPSIEIEMGPGVLSDMDTPEDYALLLENLGLPGYPDRAACRVLLAKHATPPDIVEHGEQVAALALEIARSMQAKPGARALDLPLLESACLLHDIMRAKPDHAREGMKLMLREGYPKAAMIIGSHMDMEFEPEAGVGERELLYLADKLCRAGQIVTIEERERELAETYPQGSEALRAAMARMAVARAVQEAISAD